MVYVFEPCLPADRHGATGIQSRTKECVVCCLGLRFNYKLQTINTKFLKKRPL